MKDSVERQTAPEVCRMFFSCSIRIIGKGTRVELSLSSPVKGSKLAGIHLGHLPSQFVKLIHCKVTLF